MAIITKRAALLKGLELKGWRQNQRRSTTRTIVFEHPLREDNTALFVGLAGSLRVGTSKTTSRPVIESKKQQYLQIGGYLGD
jgi:hypothetical protein